MALARQLAGSDVRQKVPAVGRHTSTPAPLNNAGQGECDARPGIDGEPVRVLGACRGSEILQPHGVLPVCWCDEVDQGIAAKVLTANLQQSGCAHEQIHDGVQAGVDSLCPAFDDDPLSTFGIDAKAVFVTSLVDPAVDHRPQRHRGRTSEIVWFGLEQLAPRADRKSPRCTDARVAHRPEIVCARRHVAGKSKPKETGAQPFGGHTRCVAMQCLNALDAFACQGHLDGLPGLPARRIDGVYDRPLCCSRAGYGGQHADDDS